jgi:MFS family permease
MLVLALVFCVGTFGLNYYATLAIEARNLFHSGADAYGWLSTLLAAGTLTGAVLAARRTRNGNGARPRIRLVVVSAMVFGVLETAVGLMPNHLTFGLMLIPTGAAALTFTTAANSAVQLSVAPTMRGRVMALYMLLFLGGTPIGGPLVGWLAAEFGGRAPIVLGGIACIVAGAAAAAAYAATAREWRLVPEHQTPLTRP